MALTKTDLKEINKLLEQQRKAINQDIAHLVSERILPQIDELGVEIKDLHGTLDRIERHFDKHEDRIERLEQIHPQGRHQAGA